MAEQDEGRLELRLGQFLKLANMVGSGGEAKVIIQDGLVEVNGEVEMRRGRHLQLGDSVSYRGRTVTVEQVLQAKKGR